MNGIFESTWGLDIEEGRSENIDLGVALVDLRNRINGVIEGTPGTVGILERQGLKLETDPQGNKYFDTSMPVGNKFIEDRIYLPSNAEFDGKFDLDMAFELPKQIIHASESFDPLSYASRILDKAHPEGLSAEAISSVVKKGFDLSGSLYAASQNTINKFGLSEGKDMFMPEASVKEWLENSKALVPIIYNDMVTPRWDAAWNIADAIETAFDPEMTFEDIKGKSIQQVKSMLQGTSAAEVADDKRMDAITASLYWAAEAREVMGFNTNAPELEFNLAKYGPVKNMVEEMLYRVDDAVFQAGLAVDAVDIWNGGDELIDTISMSYGDNNEHTMTYQFSESGPYIYDMQFPEDIAYAGSDLPMQIIAAANSFDIDRFKILSPDTPVEEFKERLDTTADYLAEEFHLARNPIQPISVDIAPEEVVKSIPEKPKALNIEFSEEVEDRMMKDAEFGSFVMASMLRFQRGDWGDVGEYVQGVNEADIASAEGLYKQGNDKIVVRNESHDENGFTTSIKFSDERKISVVNELEKQYNTFASIEDIKARHNEKVAPKNNKNRNRTIAD